MAVGPGFASWGGSSPRTALDSAEAGWYFAGSVADEFPTLEVALAAAVSWLLVRGVALGRSVSHLDERLAAFAEALERGDPARLAAFARAPGATWLAPLSRSAHAAAEKNAPSTQLREQLMERAARISRRQRSAAARDLLVFGVLAGSLVYASVTDLGATPAFYGLGGVAALLLLAAVAFRLTLERRLKAFLPALERALAGRAAFALGESSGGRCRICGDAEPTLLAAADLGPKLVELGLTEALFCRRCGHLAGRAETRG